MNGKTGVACRGIEHEVVIVWSVSSGKKQILMDGVEVHYAQGRADVFVFAWGTPQKHVLKVEARARPERCVQHQYNLLIDGTSFFDLPQTHLIGFVEVDTHSSFSPHRSGAKLKSSHQPLSGTTHTGSHDDERELQSSVAASIQESRRNLSQRPRSGYEGYY